MAKPPDRYHDEQHAERVRKLARDRARADYADPAKRALIKIRVSATRKARALDDRFAALAKYGPGCQCCGEDREPFLLIDHVDGGGNAHRQEIVRSKHSGRAGGGPNLYRWLRLNGYPGGFQVLCANCNMAKDRPGGCPHQATEEVVSSA